MPLATPVAVLEARRALSADSFPGTIRAHFPFWDAQYRPLLIEAVKAFPAEHLDYKPRPGMFTAREVAVHIAETERGWIHNVLEGGPYEEWVVPADDPAEGWRIAIDRPTDTAGLLALLEEWHLRTQAWLDRPASEIGRVFANRRPDGGPERRYTVHFVLARVQEHDIHHREQLNLYLRLLGIDPPSI